MTSSSPRANVIPQCPLEGIEIWRNEKNRFVVFELHMDADPQKRSQEYKDAIKKSMPIREYNQEYNLQWESWSGLPVYGDWDAAYHGFRGGIVPDLGLPLLRGWDWGLTPACIIAQLQGETLKVIKEYTAFNMGAERFCSIVMPKIRIQFPKWRNQAVDWLDFIDPAGFTRAQSDETSCAEILGGFDIVPRPGAITWEVRRKSVETLLVKRTKAGPGFQVSTTGCPRLVKGFNGGYQFPESAVEVEPQKLRPVKNKYSHPHDALQMITSALESVGNETHVSIPSPTYGNRGR